MKNKKFSILALALTVVLIVCAFALCGCFFDDESASESLSASESISQGEESSGDGLEAKVVLSKKTAVIEEYKSITLTATVTETLEEVVWRSSDESVATVNGGMVYGVKAGTAVIYASAGGATAECTVTVEKTSVAPTLKIQSEISIETGGVFSCEVVAKWDDETLDGVEYVWAYSEGADKEVCSFKSENETIEITGLKEGSTTLVVSAKIRGIDVSKEISVTVKKPVPSIMASGDMTITDEGCTVSFYTVNKDDKKTSADVSFDVVYGKNTYENAELEWGDFSAANVAKIDRTQNGYTISKLGAGETEVVGTYTLADGGKAEIKVKITVEKIVETIAFKPIIDVSEAGTVTVSSEIEGDVTGVTIGGRDVFASYADGNITFNNANFPKRATELGEDVEMIISTADYKYVCKADVYSMIITSKEDLVKFGENAKANGDFKNTATLDGYYILGADIDFNDRLASITDIDDIAIAIQSHSDKTNWNDVARYGFKGVFDGRGYNIDGLVVATRNFRTDYSSGGFIGYLNDAGIVRNVSFTNAGLWENCGFICSYGGGLIENVSVSYKFLGVGNKTVNIDHATYPPRTMGTFFSFNSGANAKVVNCFVDASRADIKYVYNESRKVSNLCLGTAADGKKVMNLIVIADEDNYLRSSGATTKVLTYAGLSDDIVKSAVSALPTEVWEPVSGIPFLKKFAAKIDKTIDIAITCNEEAYAGNKTEIATNEKYSLITIENLSDGIEFKGGLLYIDENVAETTLTIKAKSLINGSEAFKNLVVYAKGDTYIIESRQIVDLKAVVTADGVSSDGDVIMDVSSKYKPDKERPAKVIIGEKQYAATISPDGKIIINGIDLNSVYGEYSVTVSVAGDKIEIPSALIATKIITTADEFKAINTYAAALDMNGYYLVGNDITVNEFDAKESQIGKSGVPFFGVIDGDGYKIKITDFLDRSYSNGSWIHQFNGTIKNMSIELGSMAKYARFIYRSLGGTLENVYVKINKISYVDGAFITGNSCGKTTLTNVVTDVTSIKGEVGWTIFGKATAAADTVFNNVVVLANSAFAGKIGYGKADGKECGIYASYSDGTTNGVEFPTSDWDTAYWTVDVETKSVKWKSA